MEIRSRSITQPKEKHGPLRTSTMSITGYSGGGRGGSVVVNSPLGGSGGSQQELKALLQDYRGFGMFSLIRVLIFRGWRLSALALLTFLLLAGQWAGPVGFIAFQLRMSDLNDCPGDAGLWARCVITSVALIYTARLTVYALTYTLDPPQELGAFNMPRWWEFYRKLDLVLGSLLYDTAIFMFNLFLVFQGRNVQDMIVDVLALEFFTMIDDEFKGYVLNYDSSFLEDMLIDGGGGGRGQIAAAAHGGGHVMTASQLEGGLGVARVDGEELAPYDRRIEEADSKGSRGGGGCIGVCIDAVFRVSLFVIRLVGPLFSCFMMFYGPYCLGSPSPAR